MRNAILLTYRNHRGEVGVRQVIPIKFRFGESRYHEGEQWFMRCFDVDRNAERDYALKDCDFSAHS